MSRKAKLQSSVQGGRKRNASSHAVRAASHGLVEGDAAIGQEPNGHFHSAASPSTVESEEGNTTLLDSRLRDASSLSPSEVEEAKVPEPNGYYAHISSTSPSEADEDQSLDAIQAGNAPSSSASPDTIARLQELQVRRKHHIRVATRLTNGAGALVRLTMDWSPDAKDAEEIKRRAAKLVAAVCKGTPIKADSDIAEDLAMDLDVMRQQIELSEKAERIIKREMEKLVSTLPAYAFVKSVVGFGPLGFAVLVGEAGDLSKYQPGNSSKKAEKLWKRLGLAPYAGQALSNWRKKGGLTAGEWKGLGYAPRRRAEVYAVIEEPLFKHQRNRKGPYYEIYERRRERTAQTHPEWSKGHSHSDAKRVMVKALITDLWLEWRRAVGHVPSAAILQLPASVSSIDIKGQGQ